MKEFKIKKSYTFMIDEEDLNILGKYSEANDLTIPYCARRAIKDFIEKYVSSNIVPPAERINLGARNNFADKVIGVGVDKQ